MGIWKVDLTTAQFIAKTIEEHKDDCDGLKFPLEECPKCGGSYIKKLGHDCNSVIELEMQDVTDDDKVESL